MRMGPFKCDATVMDRSVYSSSVASHVGGCLA